MVLTDTLSHSQTQWEKIKKDCALMHVLLTKLVYQLYARIGVGHMLDVDDNTMLRAYTTYFSTVAAVSGVTGSSEERNK